MTKIKWIFQKLSLLKYNFLVLIQIIVGLSNTIFVMKFFGVSQESDSYFITLGILTTIQLLLLMLVEQFLVFYNEIKENSKKEANLFFNAALIYSIISGVLCFIILYLFSTLLLDVFASGLKEGTRFQVISMLDIMLLTLAVFPASFVLSAFLNANSYYSIPYVSTILPGLFVLMYFFYCMFYENPVSLTYLAIFYTLGNTIAFLLLWYYSNRLSKINFLTKHNQLQSFIKQSVSMRFAHNIHNFVFLFFTNNFLSYFHNGAITQFYYAKKAADTLNNIVNGPAQRILAVEITKLIPKKEAILIESLIIKFLLKNIPIFVLFTIVTYFLIPLIIPLITDKIQTEILPAIAYMFTALSVVNLLMIIEIPYANVSISSKDTSIFYFSNTLFSIVFILFSILLMNFFNEMSLLFSLVVAQIINFVLIKNKGKILLQKLKKGNNEF